MCNCLKHCDDYDDDDGGGGGDGDDDDDDNEDDTMEVFFLHARNFRYSITFVRSTQDFARSSYS